MSRKWNQTDEKEFNIVKGLQSAGFSIANAARATKRSYNTVNFMYKTDTYPEYKAFRATRKAKYAKPAVTHVPVVDKYEPFSVPVRTLENLPQPPVSTSDTLVRIAEALERLADVFESDK